VFNITKKKVEESTVVDSSGWLLRCKSHESKISDGRFYAAAPGCARPLTAWSWWTKHNKSHEAETIIGRILLV
jgi:hypothetical protein